MKKVFSIPDAVRLIPDGCTLGIGGNVLHRAPMALLREIVRQRKTGLCVVKTAGALDIDMLCLGECVRQAHVGIVDYETLSAKPSHYHNAIERGKLERTGHTYATVIAALRAAKMGVPFMPVKGDTQIDGDSEYLAHVTDPFSGEEITVARAIAPDVCILHVHEADVFGNAVITPPLYEDLLLAGASKTVIISAESVSPEPLEVSSLESGALSRFLVRAVVPAHHGAAPCSCLPLYDADGDGIDSFFEINEPDELESWLVECANT